MGLSLHLIVLLPFLLTPFVPFLARRFGARLGWVILPVPILITFYLFSVMSQVANGMQITSVWTWAPSYGLALSLVLDSFTLLFALLIAGIGSLVLFYSIFYLDPGEDLSRFYVSILLFMGAMFGVVLSENLLSLYMFWEITSISSFLLIGFWHTRSESRDGALKSMLTTVMGGLALLGGFLLLGAAGGTLSIRELIAAAPTIATHPYYPAIVVLVLLGAFTKSAQAPFHLWLPGAMAAPTPVSAYLHSATMVKAGIYLTARMSTVLGGTELWFYLVAGVAMATMLLGSYLAVQQRDLKALLAFSTVSQLGLIMPMFGFGTEAATTAGILHILNHGVFKGALFMLVGIIDHQTGTRDIERLSGLGRKMPVTGLLMFIGAFSMAGVPLLNGFVSKEMILGALLDAPFGPNLFTYALPVIAVVGSAFTTLYCLQLTLKLFFGPSGDTPVEPREAGWGLLLPPALLGSLVVLLGLFPALVEGVLVGPATSAITGRPSSVHLALWHGVNPALFMSIVALGGGALLYWQLPRVLPLLRRVSSVRINVNTIYDGLLTVMDKGSARLTGRMMTGNLRDYLVYILGFTALFLIVTMLRADLSGFTIAWGQLSPVSWSELAAIIVLIAGALTAIVARQRVGIALGVATVGFMVAILWFLWEAPDLALTQTIVETVSIVPLFLAFSYMPRLRQRNDRPRVRNINAILAVLFGGLAAVYTFISSGTQLFSSIGHYFVENSFALAGGRNIVNVILVDFRGMDTLFETTVLALVGTAIFTLVRSRRDRGGVVKPESPLMINPVIVPAVSRVLFYLVLVYSLYLFFRGHHNPGGGFAAGVMAASAVIIWALAFERTAALKLVPVHPRYVIATGLLIMVAVGLGATLLGYPFLTHGAGNFHIPYLGEIELASATFFDLGVLLVVFGVIHWIMVAMSDGIALEQEHVRAYRKGVYHLRKESSFDGTSDRT